MQKSLEPGARIGDYVLVRELGRGGMGVVYEARHMELDRRVALKVLLAPLGAAPEARRFEVEAQTLAKLDHPNVVRVHELGTSGGRLFLVMDYVEGESLEQVLKREGPLAPREAAFVALQLARGLDHAHEHGVLHRDVKPANVLLAEGAGPLLVDFGVARDLCAARERLTCSGEVLGTPAFMPPEQASGQLERIDERADVYALGATLYAALTGRPPFVGATVINVLAALLSSPPPSIRSLRPEVEPDLEAVCLKCLAKEPEDRYPSAAALAEELGRYARGEPVQAISPGAARNAARWLRRGAMWLVPASLLIGLVVLATLARISSPLKSHLAALDDPRPARRAEAARAIGEIGSEALRAEDALTRALENDADPGVRIEIAVALGKVGGVAAIGPLSRVLADADPRLRSVAGRALVRIGPRGVGALVTALADDAMRLGAEDALSEAGGAGVPALLDMLRGQRAGLEEPAARLLTRIGEPAVPGLIRLLREGDAQAAVAQKVLLGIGEPAVPALARFVRDATNPRRWVAIWILGTLGPRAATGASALIEVQGEESAEIRGAAHRALTQVGAAAYPQLLQGLSDTNARIRAACAGQLGAHPSRARESVPALVVCARDEDRNVKLASLSALRGLGLAAQEALPVFEEGLLAADFEVRRASLRAVGECAPAPERIRLLAPLLEDPSADVRSLAVTFLADLGPCARIQGLIDALSDLSDIPRAAVSTLGTLAPKNDWASEALIAAMQHPRPDVQGDAIVAVGDLGGQGWPEAHEALVQTAGAANLPRARLLALELLSELDPEKCTRMVLDAIDREAPLTREALVRMLSDLRAKTDVVRAKLVTLLEDPAPGVREAACLALLQNDPRSAVLPLLAALQDSEPLVRKAAASALGYTGSREIVGPLARIAGNTDEPTGLRVAAIQSLAKLGPLAADAVSALEDARRDADTTVQNVARYALGEILK